MPDVYSSGSPLNEVHAIPWSVEDAPSFRLAELILLLAETGTYNKKINSLDRIGYYAFFSSHPFVIVEGHGEKGLADRVSLNAAGFSNQQLSYGSIGPRYVKRRRVLPLDLEVLVAHRLAALSGEGFVLTPDGHRIAESLVTAHADSYRISSKIILKRLARLSDSKLNAVAREALGNSWLLLDFTDDVRETETYN